MSKLVVNESLFEKFLCFFFKESRYHESFGRFDIVKEVNGKLTLYLRRFRILSLKYFGIYLHHIAMPDQDRHLHDHPWDFGVFILKGGYTEQTNDTVFNRKRFSFRFQKAEQLHRITMVKPGTWTLFFRGTKRRHWGFQTETGWKHWQKYLQDEGIYEHIEGEKPIDPDSFLANEEVK